MTTLANIRTDVTAPHSRCTNLPHEYYVGLVKLLLKKSTHADKYRLAEVIEREAMRISSANQDVQQAKVALVTKVIMGGTR